MLAASARFTSDLDAQLTAYEKRIQSQVCMAGTAAMANVIYEEAKELAPVYEGPPKKGIKPGQLRDAIYRVFSESRSGETVKTYQISWNKKKAPHGFLLEFGHWTKRVGNVGPLTPVWVPGRAFLRRAFDRAKDGAEAAKKRMAEVLASDKEPPASA